MICVGFLGAYHTLDGMDWTWDGAILYGRLVGKHVMNIVLKAHLR